MATQNRPPDIEVRSGGIVGSVWSDAAAGNDGGFSKHSIRIEKRYRDDRTGEWKTTGYLRVDDLPRLALVANKLFEQVTLRVGQMARGGTRRAPPAASAQPGVRRDSSTSSSNSA